MSSESMATDSMYHDAPFSLDEFQNVTMAETQDDSPPFVFTYKVDPHQLIWPALFTVLVVAANSLTLTAFSVEKRLRTYNNYFIINLCIADLIVGFYLIIRLVHTYTGYYPLNQSFCKVLSGLGQSVINTSNFAIVVICIDRHRATYDPINHFTTRSKHRALILNAIPWLVSFTFWMLFITAWEFIDDFNTGIHCFRRYSRITGAYIVRTCVTFYGPLLIISVLYLRILLKIRGTVGAKNVERKFESSGDSKPKMTALPKESESSSSAAATQVTDIECGEDAKVDDGVAMKAMKHEDWMPEKKSYAKRESSAEMRKATKTLLFIVLSFVVAWLPFSITFLIYAIEPVLVYPGVPTEARLFFNWLAYCNSLLNPISYAITQPLLRKTLKNMICRCS